MDRVFKERETHIKRYPQFNVLDNTILTLESIRDILLKKGEGNTIRILEIGTKRSNPAVSTHHKPLFSDIPHLQYDMLDYQSGLDVDIVCDLHKTEGTIPDNYYDLIISCSTFEHLKYPQLCAHNLMKSLTIDGMLFISTHQTYPLHGYKYDYYRFSREALKSLFSPKMNMKELSSYFDGICAILPHRTVEGWNTVAESYLNVIFVGIKIAQTPATYIYDIDTT
jgi:hypothetical protein